MGFMSRHLATQEALADGLDGVFPAILAGDTIRF